MSGKPLSFTQKQIIDQFASMVSDEGARQLSIGEIVALLRKRLLMTQSQLAKRTGYPQSYISKIEGGVQEPNLKTLRKLYGAFACGTVVVPVASENFDEMLLNQARKYLQKHMDYVEGTMSLEKQLPHKKFTKALLEEEARKLVFSGDTKIWDVS